MNQKRLIRSLRARIAALEAQNARLKTPNMFWDDHDFEGSLTSNFAEAAAEEVADCSDDLHDGGSCVVTLQCARELPNQEWLVAVVDGYTTPIGLVGSEAANAFLRKQAEPTSAIAAVPVDESAFVGDLFPPSPSASADKGEVDHG